MPNSFAITTYFIAGGDGEGSSTFRRLEAPFDYTNSGINELLAVIENERVVLVGIQILTMFNDGAATISVGHTGNAEGLMEKAMNIPQQVGYYEVVPLFGYGGADIVKLYLDPKSATQGSGIVYLGIDKNLWEV